MEIQKKKETQWVIKKKDGKGAFKLKYYEDAGIITDVGIGLKDLDKEIFFEMTPLEFKNFVSVLKSFINLLYAEGLELMNVDLLNNIQEAQTTQNESQYDDNIDNSTEKEIENLRQIEAGNQQQDISQPDKLISQETEPNENSGNIESEQLILDPINNLHDFPPLDERNEINTEKIFNEIDNIVPTVENGDKGEQENRDTDNLTKTNDNNNEFEIETKDEQKKKNGLDPKDWDPW